MAAAARGTAAAHGNGGSRPGSGATGGGGPPGYPRSAVAVAGVKGGSGGRVRPRSSAPGGRSGTGRAGVEAGSAVRSGAESCTGGPRPGASLGRTWGAALCRAVRPSETAGSAPPAPGAPAPPRAPGTGVPPVQPAFAAACRGSGALWLPLRACPGLEAQLLRDAAEKVFGSRFSGRRCRGKVSAPGGAPLPASPAGRAARRGVPGFPGWPGSARPRRHMDPGGQLMYGSGKVREQG